MPKKIHDKVRELLDSKTFYPEKSEKEREDLAWPIATNIIKKSSFNLRRFVFAQVNQDLLNSDSIEEFVEKFTKYGEQNPGLVTRILFSNYIKANSTYNNERLSKYPAFVALLNFLNTQNRIVTKEEIKKYLDDKQTENPDNFKASIDRKDAPEADKSDAPEVDLTKQTGVTGDSVINNLPKQQNATGNYGTPGLQDVIQYTSQSAAAAPKNEEQKKASERMFMMDNMLALKVLSRNIYDVNALRNFQKVLTFSKNHIGTRFEEPVNNLLSKYGELASTPNTDRKTKNKLGAEIQYIIQNELLGSGVRPSDVGIALIDPKSRTDYLYSGSKPPTPYQFRYLEDVYFDMKDELTNKFNEDRKAFAEQYIKDNPQISKDFTADNFPENFYPDELKQMAKPGTPYHQRAWMEKNKKTELEKLNTQTSKDSSLKTTEGPAINESLGAPNLTGPAFDSPGTSGKSTPPAKDTPPPPPPGGAKTSASQNLQKLKYNNRATSSSK